MSNLKRITLDDFTISFDVLRDFHKNSNEPLPEYGDKSKLLSVLDYPFQSVFGKVLFWGFYKKAACYFYGFSKGHIFSNGNKRSGVMAVNLFYKINNRKLNIPENKMYELSKYIANTKAEQKDETILYIYETLKKYE
jgi:death-on-curing family protein